MGCGLSSLRGDDVPSVNANPKPAYMRAISSTYPKSSPTEHYETTAEHEAELRRVQSSQANRRPSRPAYVDPDDLPMPPKTTHQHYHRKTSENPTEKDTTQAGGWKDMVKRTKGEAWMPAERARGYSRSGSSGVIVPNSARHRSYIG